MGTLVGGDPVHPSISLLSAWPRSGALASNWEASGFAMHRLRCRLTHKGRQSVTCGSRWLPESHRLGLILLLIAGQPWPVSQPLQASVPLWVEEGGGVLFRGHTEDQCRRGGGCNSGASQRSKAGMVTTALRVMGRTGSHACTRGSVNTLPAADSIRCQATGP